MRLTDEELEKLCDSYFDGTCGNNAENEGYSVGVRDGAKAQLKKMGSCVKYVEQHPYNNFPQYVQLIMDREDWQALLEEVE